jgi:FKBP12-rapamycin complex-associated protein
VACIGELARVAGEELVPNVDTIVALVVDMLNDQSSVLKRDAALKTLGQVVSNTAMPIKPYTTHPQLLGILFRLLRTETSQAIRLETIRTMGMLGALDPFKHKVRFVSLHSCATFLGLQMQIWSSVAVLTISPYKAK